MRQTFHYYYSDSILNKKKFSVFMNVVYNAF